MGVGLSAKPILIVEDYEPDAKLLELALKEACVGNPLIFVTDGDEAICYLNGAGTYANREANPLPGLMLLDLKLPRTSGYEVIEWCRSQPQFRELVIVVLSGQHDLNDVSRAYQLGANTFLVKPAAVGDIRRLVLAHPGVWTVG